MIQLEKLSHPSTTHIMIHIHQALMQTGKVIDGDFYALVYCFFAQDSIRIGRTNHEAYRLQ